MNGILIVNKPSGKTSHDVVDQVRRLLNIKKVGHAGTLDPIATGVLVILVGKGTKLSDYLLNKDKLYRAGILLGRTTDTYDITGKIVCEKEVNVSIDDISSTLDKFKGRIEQLPPIYSAVKKKGKKLYQFARAGIEVEREARKVEIFSLDVVDFNNLTIDVHCSKGTYIRSLIHDIGQDLGCGACMQSLVRLSSGNFKIENSITLEQLEQKGGGRYIQSIDSVFLDYETINVNGDIEFKVKNGNSVKIEDLKPGIYRVYGENKGFICLGEVFRMGGQLILKSQTMFI